MRAITISVDYHDMLAVTLPYNRHHFDEVWVVSSWADDESIRTAIRNDCNWFRTDAFYRDDATFNKWLALEEGLNAMGRHGWICVMDADILWPKNIDWPELEVGNIYGPKGRRMHTNIRNTNDYPPDIWNPAAQWHWDSLPLHPTSGRELAGYTQVFHADDPHLGEPPWYETDWKHAGGADSFFPRKWPEENRIHLPFEVLHLGESGKNWMGRCTPYLDGTEHPEAAERQRQMTEMLRKRRQVPRRRRDYREEKL